MYKLTLGGHQPELFVHTHGNPPLRDGRLEMLVLIVLDLIYVHSGRELNSQVPQRQEIDATDSCAAQTSRFNPELSRH